MPLYERLKLGGCMNNPNVFISYSHDSEEHKAWVLKLASDLRSHGVNAILDQWDLRIGSDLRFFMENGLSNANLVLCICSENYVEKVNLGKGGSGYEGMIMTQALLQNANAEFIVSIVRNNTSTAKVPFAFGSKLYVDFSEDEQYVARYQELLERIYGEDSKKKPSLGKNPFSGDIGRQIEIKTRHESVNYHSVSPSGTVVFRFDNNNGRYFLGNGEYYIETRWSRAGNNSIHAYGAIGFDGSVTEIPPLESITNFDFSSNARTIKKGQVVIFKNPNHHFAAIKLGEVKSSGHGFPYDEMTFDYHIYEMA